MSLGRTVARLVTERRRWIVFAVLVLLAAAALQIRFGVQLASDILDLLPRSTASLARPAN
ncbi:MAG: hypothetical protein M3463_13615 [Verrucomicrobiota bacterium]|nr:hypothetical protein [Verrucomicrobiota bacterium]